MWRSTVAGSLRGADESTPKPRFLPAQGALLAVAGWLAWRPAETFPWSAVLVAAVVLGLAAWGWNRTPPAAGRAAVWAVGGIGVLLVSGLAGHDPSAAIAGVSLVATITVLIWLASRETPPESWPAVLALVIAGLSIWGVLQVTAGPEHTEAILRQLPEALRSAGSERLASGRAFASQPLPSHLAVLFATALPLLLVRVRWRWNAAPWIAGCALCVFGLALTRSPIGVGLALAACAALAVARGGRSLRLVVGVLVLVLAVVIVARGDVLELEPVSLRLDNWRTAVWVWSTSPAAGVGFGGFGQVAQTVPFAVGNRPRFAHSLPLGVAGRAWPGGFLGDPGGWLRAVAPGSRPVAASARSGGCDRRGADAQSGGFFDARHGGRPAVGGARGMGGRVSGRVAGCPTSGLQESTGGDSGGGTGVGGGHPPRDVGDGPGGRDLPTDTRGAIRGRA